MITGLHLSEYPDVTHGSKCGAVPELGLGHRAKTDFFGFEGHLVEGSRRWAGFSCSLLAHCAGGFVVWAAGTFLPQELARPARRYVVTEPPALYVHLRATRIALPAKSAMAAASSGGIDARAVASAVAGTRPERGSVRKMRLPRAVPRAESEQTLLQPEFAPQLPPVRDIRLPEFTFWSHAARPVERKRFVEPGRAVPAAAEPRLQAEPMLSLPTEATSAGVLAAAAVIVDAPKLPVAAAAAPPLQTVARSGEKPTPTASINLAPGDASAVIALNPRPGADTVAVVPAGNQIGRMAEGAPGDGGASAGAAHGTGAGGPGPGSAPGGETGSRQGTERAAAGGHSAGAGGGGAAGEPAVRPEGAIRRSHPDGVFDVVIADPSPAADAATGRRLLEGAPVYTVYVNVGGSQEWQVKYCAPPTRVNRQAQGNVVTLDRPSPLQPPYPRVTVVPPQQGARGPVAVLHGFLTAAGRFRGLQAVRPEDLRLFSRLQDYLQQWEFHPATQDGVAVEVEVLLLLPRLLL